MKQQRNPTELDMSIQVDAAAMQKFWLWTMLAQGEVSALGVVDTIRNVETGRITCLRVIDFHLIKQICNAAETEMDPVSIAELLTKIEDPGKLRCWAHSHADMGIFWSKTDDECIQGLANDDWVLSLVVNKRKQSMMRLDIFHPTHLYMQDVVWAVHYPLEDGFLEAAQQEFKDKVIESSYFLSRQEDLLPDDPTWILGHEDEEIYEELYAHGY